MNPDQNIKIIECPRDAMQGWKRLIPTPQKTEYLNQLGKVGFNSLDFGSFVSPKKIPQMADTPVVADLLDPTRTKLLAIVANKRGASNALKYSNIYYLGFPFSVSPTFQERNINSSVQDSFDRIKEIQRLCKQAHRELVVYISMAFGNPYGDRYDHDVVTEWIGKIVATGVNTISLSDTVGVATPKAIADLFRKVKHAFKQVETGVHLHSTPETREEKLAAAVESGCRRFDGALHGIGGCPMAEDKLVGNMDTLTMVDYFKRKGYAVGLNEEELAKAARLANKVFV